MNQKDNKQILSRNLKKLLVEHDLSQADLAKALNITEATVSNWVNGLKFPRDNALNKISKLFDISVSELVDGEIPDSISSLPLNAWLPQNDNIKIPFYGDVSAGLGDYAGGYPAEDYEMIPSSKILSGYEYFCLRVDGDSMEPELHNGDTVLIRCQSIVENGDIGVAIVDGERGLIKRIFVKHNQIELQPENESYSPEIFKGADTNRVRILGKVVSVNRDY